MSNKNISNIFEILKLPPEIIIYIISFCDEISIIKLERVFKKNKIGISFLHSLFEQKQRLQNSVRNYWNSMYYDYFLNKSIERTSEILECEFDSHFVVSRNINGLWVTKNDLYNSYLSKTTKIQTAKALRVPIERLILLLIKKHNSAKFAIVRRDCIDETAVFFIERIFQSHVTNCLCRNIHDWCKGYYCDGCKFCDVFYPTSRCKNIKRKRVRLWSNESIETIMSRE